jgi:hypothetical protein
MAAPRIKLLISSRERAITLDESGVRAIPCGGVRERALAAVALLLASALLLGCVLWLA